jgi:hypothetical protein
MRYEEYLQRKSAVSLPTGISDPEKAAHLFDYQNAVASWALKRGRAAIFAGTGLGKTAMQLEWARQVNGRTGNRVLILAPLAVGPQTEREAKRFGIDARYVREPGDGKIEITNYEKLDKFDCDLYGAVVLDESSILKNFSGRMRNEVIAKFARHPFRLACSATPAPNDFMEFGNHAEFLGICSYAEMLATYFTHDGGDTSKWRLKGHGADKFFQWLASWALYFQNPEDLGFDGSAHKLPELETIYHVIETARTRDGYLFAPDVQGLSERRSVRKDTIAQRVAIAKEICEKAKGQVCIWAELNDESAAAAKEIEGAVEIKGADDPAHKEKSVLDFADKKIKRLVSKPSITGYGVNWQQCSETIFLGLSDSWEQYYQAVRRFWRFGQKKKVKVHVIIADAERPIYENIKRKEDQAKEARTKLIKHMETEMKRQIGQAVKITDQYKESTESGGEYTLLLGDCVQRIKEIETASVGYSIFSPPFASLYTYSNSDRDMGNSKSDADFLMHFRFLARELYRVLMPGRLLSFHCMLLPSLKQRDGVIGLKDFRGSLIRLFERAGFVFHSEVVIWKDPVTAMQRTKAIGLLHKQVKKDSALSRQGIPDYLVTMRKPDANPEPISHTNETFPVGLWQQYASPVWMDINPSDTLQYRSARDNNDERHICPLQLEVIRRGLKLWSNSGDIVLSPFAGIGSEGYVAIQEGRQFIGIELKESYFRAACNNLKTAASERGGELFASIG